MQLLCDLLELQDRVVEEMASRPKGYGMSGELQEKREAKYDPKLEGDARDWLVALVGEPWPTGNFHESLEDGVYLCKAMNKLVKGSIPNISNSKMAFKKMENIGKFLDKASAYGVPKADLFQTVDLYENTNMNQVILAIYALGRVAQKKAPSSFPRLGPKESTKNARHFDAREQKIAGGSVIGLQMGTNRGASQAGMTPYGLQRQVDKTNLYT